MRYGRLRTVLMADGVRTFQWDTFCAKNSSFVSYTARVSHEAQLSFLAISGGLIFLLVALAVPEGFKIAIAIFVSHKIVTE